MTVEGHDTQSDSTGPVEREKAKNELFFALSNHRRRFVLDYLYREDGACQVRDLVESLAAWENDIEVPMTTSVQRKRAYVSLRQSHLPKLADMRLIEYEPSRGVVSTGERWKSVEGYLQGPASSGSYSNAVVAALIGLTVLGLGVGFLSLTVL